MSIDSDQAMVLNGERGRQRFVFLSDAHCVAPLVPIQERIAQWCHEQVRLWAPDRVILGGDLTHHPRSEQARAFLEGLQVVDRPLDYLPGNNEGGAFAFPAGTLGVEGCRELEADVFLLATSSRDEAERSVDALLDRLPESGGCLVFAHFPPFLAGEERLRRLEAAPVAIQWICGHRHEALESQAGNLKVTIAAGLDPIKVRRSLPELLVVDWEGAKAKVERVRVTPEVLHGGKEALNQVGLAFRGTAETLLRVATQRGIGALQFHYHHSFGEATEDEKRAVCEYRAAVPEAFLSLHLPNFPHPAEGVDLADQEKWLHWAEAIGVDDLTIHLPNVSASFLFGEDRELSDTPWARGCLATYDALSRRALQMGAQISFENVYNKQVNPPGAERLGSQPWHLLAFVEAVRSRLGAEGVAKEELERIGIIFDAGHAFADVHYSKVYGLADWLMQVSPYLQLSHVHQVLPKPEGGGTCNHQTIAERFGPLVNYFGLLAAFRDAARKPFPLLVEVRGEEGALESYETLLATGLCASSPVVETLA